MRIYLEVARYAFRRYATYRAATVAGVLTNTVWAFIRAYIFIAVWGGRHSVAGYDVAAITTFVFLSQALSAPLSMFGLSIELPQRIRTGDVAVDLQRPADMQSWWLANDLGRASFQLLGRAFPFLVGVIAFDLRLPGTLWAWLTFAVSVYLGIVVSFALRYLVSLTVWWLMDAHGVEITAQFLMLFFSGMVVPLVLLPGWFGQLVALLPWAAVLQVPADVFLGRYSPTGTLTVLAFQAVWAVLLLAGGRLITARMRHAVVVQGG